ncbi:MAG: nucleotidyltransferase family protein, partial [Anaerolineae bacterium]|nr:nucleotidyltransferase family protein [Anaerolineae bacterium]
SQRLAEAGIRAIWLKGVALALTVYPEPGLRAMTDVDVLVPAQQAEEAMRVIAAATGRPPATLGASLDKHAVADVGPANSVRLEVHWSLVDLPYQRGAEDTAWFLAGRTPLPGGADFYGPAPEAHLLYLCAHAEIVHGEADFLLQRYLDLHQLVTVFPALDWDVVVGRAADFGWTYATERALVIAQRFFRTPVPSSLLDDLRRARPASENMARIARRQAALDEGERLLRRWDDLDWGARLRLTAGSLFPSPAYMRRRYDLKAGWQVALAYPWRWASATAQVSKALLKRLAASNRRNGNAGR